MLVDRSGRTWAMRPDAAGVAQALALREDRERAADGGAKMLPGSDFARIVRGVAVVPVRGMLLRSANLFYWSYEEVERDIALAQADPEVTAILLDIDSGGGMAAGVGDLAKAIRAGGPKPIEAFVGGMAASAAYYIAAAASRITVGSAATVGSIGTVIEYVDLEPYFQKLGARIVRVVAEQSPNKRLDPDSDEGRAEMQALCDACAAEFVADVAAFRGLSEAEVLARFGQGLVFDGGEALRRGMVDARGTLMSTIAEMAGRASLVAGPAPAATEDSMDWGQITAAALREHRAELVAEIEAAARAQGADAERARIAAIEEAALPGHEGLVAAAKADRTATAETLALRIVAAEKARRGRSLTARAEAEAAVDLPAVVVTDSAPAAKAATPEGWAAEFAASADLQAEFGAAEVYVAWRKAEAARAARVPARAN